MHHPIALSNGTLEWYRGGAWMRTTATAPMPRKISKFFSRVIQELHSIQAVVQIKKHYLTYANHSIAT